MKRTNLFWMCAAAVAVLTTGCMKEVAEGPGTDPQAGDGTSLVVSIAPQDISTRVPLLGPTEEAKIATYEKNITGFTAYLFDGTTGAFLEKGSTSAGAKQVVFDGYEAGDEVQVVAFANVGSVVIPDPANITDFEAASLDAMVDLSSQLVTDYTVLSKGFFMSGRYGAGSKGNMDDADALANGGVYPVVEGPNVITVPAERVVAKIVLGSVTFGPNVTIGDIVNFKITGAAIQEAIGTAFVYPGEIVAPYPTTPTYYGAFSGGTNPVDTSLAGMAKDTGTASGGLIDITNLVTTLLETVADNLTELGIANPLGIVSGTLEFLIDNVVAFLGGVLDFGLFSLDDILTVLDVPINTVLGLVEGEDLVNLQDLLISRPNNFWYVLPNSPTNVPTLLTLEGEYHGQPYYYPIDINTPTSNPSADGGLDGKGVGIRRNTKYVVNVTFTDLIGTDDPNDPSKGTNLIVKLDVLDWEGEVEQNTTW